MGIIGLLDFILTNPGYLPRYMPVIESQINPIFIPKNRHWAEQRRLAKKARKAIKHKQLRYRNIQRENISYITINILSAEFH